MKTESSNTSFKNEELRSGHRYLISWKNSSLSSEEMENNAEKGNLFATSDIITTLTATSGMKTGVFKNKINSLNFKNSWEISGPLFQANSQAGKLVVIKNR